MKSIFIAFFIITGVSVFLSCASAVKIKNYLGNEIFEVISSPDSVESFQVDPKKKAPGKKLHGFPILKKGPNFTKDQVCKLQSIILNDNTYNFEMAKRGFVFPEYAFKMVKADREVVLFACFFRKEVMYVYNNREFIEDFDSAEKDMKNLIDEIFGKI